MNSTHEAYKNELREARETKALALVSPTRGHVAVKIQQPLENRSVATFLGPSEALELADQLREAAAQVDWRPTEEDREALSPSGRREVLRFNPLEELGLARLWLTRLDALAQKGRPLNAEESTLAEKARESVKRAMYALGHGADTIPRLQAENRRLKEQLAEALEARRQRDEEESWRRNPDRMGS